VKSCNSIKISSSIWILSGLMLSGFLGRAGISLAAEDTWTYKTDMPSKRLMTGGGVIDEKIYIIGGAPSNFNVASVVEVYDPHTDTWTRMANMPEGRCYPASCVFDGKIYVFGGIHPSPYSMAKKSVYVYDPQTDSWTQKRDMPNANACCGIAVVDGTIYLIGGMPSTSSAPLSTVMAYDPFMDSWTRKTDMPTARGALSACVVDAKIYAIGGTRQDWTTFSYKRVEVYDPSTDTWTRKSDMTTQRWGLGTCEVDGRIYAVGGRSGSDVCAANEVYDPTTDIWTIKSSMQQKRNGSFVCSIGDKIYSIGGVYLAPHDVFLSTVEEYDTGLGAPSPDFNNDGIVDLQDLLILIESWGQDEPLCDIAPAPFGDGIVDALDLELSMSYWGQEIDDPTLIAHWALDETEGTIAYDSAGVNDAVIIGNAAWQPDGGQIDGALQLDGIDGCVVAGPALNPTDGPFSIFTWIKGGAPGQVVVSQQGATDWLMASVEGNLMTDLKATGRSGGPLQSQAIIADVDWHRVGFVWDGLYRSLYVDDILAAEDTQDGLGSSNSGMYIGTGKLMTPGTYWSGLIDEIRIYDRAVSP